ncbi:MAG TPA: SPOR domain-containing protein [Gemmatimonadales bacterium]|nr:SPOR domain-containing protein [Gemmatimonadales bacterium]
MILPARHASLLFIAGLAACGTGGPPKIPDAEGRQVMAVSLLRWPTAGGKPALYRFPTLQPALWEARSTTPALKGLVGVDIDLRQAFALGAKDTVYALDLESGRSRPFLADVALADAGPDGVVYAVSRERTLTSVSGRLPTAYPGKLPAIPVALVGTGSDQVYALVPGDSGLVVIRQGQAPRRELFPAAGMVHTRWGDLLAAAGGNEVELFEPTATRPARTLDIGGKPAALAFSPSGHRLYAVAEGEEEVRRYDRYSLGRLGTIDLPAPAKDLRPDPFGRFLLVRPAQGDSVWVLDVVKSEFLGSFTTTWRADLPALAGGRWLLVREGADVVSYDLFDAEFAQTGKVKGGAADLWQTLDWTPRAEAGVAAAADSVAPEAASTGRAVVYVQLSSSQNPAWAQELADKMKSQGLPASVIRPKKQDEAYRVVLGPYPSRDAADSAGTRLGQPYFLYLPEDR